MTKESPTQRDSSRALRHTIGPCPGGGGPGSGRRSGCSFKVRGGGTGLFLKDNNHVT